MENKKVYKLYFKKNDCSMALFKGLTYFAAKHRRDVLQNMYKEWNGKFIIGV